MVRALAILAVVSACGGPCPEPAAPEAAASGDAPEAAPGHAPAQRPGDTRVTVTSKDVLAARAFEALQQGDAAKYLTFMPGESDLPASCELSQRYARLIPHIQGAIRESVKHCGELIAWDMAEVQALGYDYTPQPEGNCMEVISHGDATYQVVVGDERFKVTVEDVMQIGDRFFSFDSPQCHRDDPAP